MREQLIVALGVEFDLTAEEIADILWLALQQSSESFSSSQPSSEKQPVKSTPAANLPAPDDSKRSNPSACPPSPQPSVEEPPTDLIAEDNPKAQIYTTIQSNRQRSRTTGTLPLTVPDAPSLREPLSLTRALRPLMSRVPSPKATQINETATAERTAAEGLCIPVLQPLKEPWLEIALVIDESISMVIWRHTVTELKRLLEHYGAFRDVRTWGLVEQQKTIFLRAGIGVTTNNPRLHSPKELIDPAKRRLVLVVSDCVSAMWRNGNILPPLQVWAENGPLAVVQMLPEWLWDRTALGLATSARFSGLTPGVANTALQMQVSSLWDEEDFEQGIKVPVLTLEPEMAATWSKMVSGQGNIWTPGFVFALDPDLEEETAPQENSTSLSAEERVQGFRLNASPMARRLAGLLSAAPTICLPVVRIIQDVMLPASRQVNVSEVFLGGLLKPVSEIKPNTNPDAVQYDFIEGVRELLLNSTPQSDSLTVLNAVSEYVAKRIGKTLQEFEALLRNPQEANNPDEQEQIQHFAEITAKVLSRLGGEYARFAENLLEQRLEPGIVEYALLIGIDFYFPHRLLDGKSYRNLKGCVRDINQAESFLMQLPTPPKQIFKLTASVSEDPTQPIEPPEQLPTYENIIAAFKQMTEIAEPGDRIYIHLSAHEGKIKTIYPEIKGESALDLALVPTDIGNSENGRYLRDLEIASLLRGMADKKLMVIGVLDGTLSGLMSPDGIFGAEILPIEGCVLLTGCRPGEPAYEKNFDGQPRGVFTYYLLQTLAQTSFKVMTYQMLHDSVKAKVRNQVDKQTPMLRGEGDRLMFGWKYIPVKYTATVSKVDPDKKQIQLNIGQVQGFRDGAEFILYPFGTITFSADQQLALVKLIEVGSSYSLARIHTIFSDQPIEVGDWAILTLASANLVHQVYLIEDDTITTKVNQQAALQKLKDLTFRKTWIEFSDEVEQADYFVRVTILDEEKAEQYQAKVNEVVYEICGRTQVPILLQPVLKVNEPKSVSRLIQRVIHITKYQIVETLDTNDPMSILADKIAVRITTEPNPNQYLNPADNPTEVIIDEDQTYWLEIQNHSDMILNIAVFNLQPNWAIRHVLKDTMRLEMLTLQPQQKATIPLPDLEKYGNLKNIFKIIACVDDINFRLYELPPLDQDKQAIQDIPINPLEGRLLQEMTAEEPSDRNLTPTPEDESSEPEGSTLTRVTMSVDGWIMKQFTVFYRFFD